MKHPTVDIPDLGPMDHAWDALGEWTVELAIPYHEEPISGTLQVHSWMEADLELEPWGAAAAGLPEQVTLERASRIHLTDAGGGALQWVFFSPEDRWTIQATLWPGAMHLFIQDADDQTDELFRANASRSREYYLRKYPLVAR